MGNNRVIGRDGGLPWRLPKDMRHFMATTMGKPCIMGRKTFESMKAPLPGRTNIVMTSDRSWQRDGVKVAHDWAEALSMAADQCRIDGQDEAMIIGGANVYALALPHATRLYLTEVDACPEGDVHFPELDLEGWELVASEAFSADETHSASFTISEFRRGGKND
jgi:dihydrofolate reductase